MARLLVVDDDRDLLRLISESLRSSGHEVSAFDNPALARNGIAPNSFDLLLTDLEMPGMSGMDLLRAARDADPNLVVMVLTGRASIDSAVEAMKAGAFDYLRKPFPVQELLVVIEKGLRHRELITENARLKSELHEKYHYGNMVGSSSSMHQVYRMIERVGPTASSVLILGESGTGKELVARAIHEISPRRTHRFLKINCAAVAESLLEGELFGHERGAFTGAVATRRGLFEAAQGGTLFLDEVGDTSPSLQAKLLRVLQEGEIRRVGGTDDIHVDVRVVAATHRDLKRRIAEGLFREDLFFRLNVVSLSIPPLRDRTEDIPLLVDWFIRKKAEDAADGIRLAPEVEELFRRYAWPGNVRELENAIERALVLRESDTLRFADLPDEIRFWSPGDDPGMDPGGLARLPLAEVERIHIERVLATVAGNRSRAAEVLGITRRSLYDRLKRYGVEGGER